jgi:hypothetical protein
VSLRIKREFKGKREGGMWSVGRVGRSVLAHSQWHVRGGRKRKRGPTL